jgi:DNA polymerase elongation subunit (family B)
MRKPKVLLLDIETAPTLAYIWDLFTRYVPHSQIAEPGHTLCWAAKWLGQQKVMYKSTYHDGEEEMVVGAHELLEEADIVIHYNGTKFDIPKLNNEFLVWDLGPPAPFVQVDLYKTAKGRFKLLSNSLAYLAKTLGLEGKMQHKGMDLWTECMANDPAAWATMRKYNIRDVQLLEEVYEILLPWIQPHPNLALWNDIEMPQCPACGSQNLYKHPQIHVTQTMRYQRLKCRDCGKWSRERVNNLEPGKKKAVLVGVA